MKQSESLERETGARGPVTGSARRPFVRAVFRPSIQTVCDASNREGSCLSPTTVIPGAGKSVETSRRLHVPVSGRGRTTSSGGRLPAFPRHSGAGECVKTVDPSPACAGTNRERPTAPYSPIVIPAFEAVSKLLDGPSSHGPGARRVQPKPPTSSRRRPGSIRLSMRGCILITPFTTT